MKSEKHKNNNVDDISCKYYDNLKDEWNKIKESMSYQNNSKQLCLMHKELTLNKENILIF